MGLTRRDLLKASAAAAAGLLAARPLGAVPRLPLYGPPGAKTAARASKLFGAATFLAHADLHNHSHLSDGTGDPARAYGSMRDAGLDIAALTDHSTVNFGAFSVIDPCQVFEEPEEGQRSECYNHAYSGINEERWQTTLELAAAADAPDQFVAIPGFEWSSPFLGHINMWFSQRWMDPLHTAGWDPSGMEDEVWPAGRPPWDDIPGGEQLREMLIEANKASPFRGTGMLPFYTWMTLPPSTPVWGGGADGIASFNHPGREPGRFSYFRHFPEVHDQFVAMEILNRREDYLFKNWHLGRPSPLVECLNAGWRVGLSGASDDHGTQWGFPEGDGRTGVWTTGLTRQEVREALADRRIFATREYGLRFDASANDARMGRGIPHASGDVTFSIDLAHPDLADRHIEIQVLRPDDMYPEVIHAEAVVVDGAGELVHTFTVPLSRDDGPWVVLRVADPALPNDAPGPDGHPCNNRALVYSSPWWLDAV